MPKAYNAKNPLPYERLTELLHYDPLTGIFTWRVNRRSYGGKVKIGAIAGTPDRYGYCYIGIDGGICQAHVLAWVYVYKTWPVCQIDHRNMVVDDNRIDNLREASMVEQRANQRVRKDSTLGLKGVRRHNKSSYMVRITKDGVTHYKYGFKSPQEAHAAYREMAAKLFGEFARSI